MKKILCMTMLMLAALSVSAMAQMKAASPPEQDIGYQQAATLSLDGMTVYAFHSQLTPEQALAAVEIAKEELIDKATSYIQQHWIWNTKMIEDFKKALGK